MSPIDLDPFIAKLHERIEYGQRLGDAGVWLSKETTKSIVHALESARDALAGQDQAAIGLRGLIPSHERIGEKYRNIPQPPTALEKLIFDTTVVDPEQGEALRAFMQGYVPVVTP